MALHSDSISKYCKECGRGNAVFAHISSFTCKHCGIKNGECDPYVKRVDARILRDQYDDRKKYEKELDEYLYD